MNPLLIFVLVIVVLVGGIVVVFQNETRKAGGIKVWLADFPTTPARIFVSIVLSVFFVVVVMLLTVLSTAAPIGEVRELPDTTLDTIVLFLLMMMGIDTVAYVAKRLTHKANGGNDPPPGSTAQMPIPVGAQQVTVATQGGPSQTTVTTQPAAPVEGA